MQATSLSTQVLWRTPRCRRTSSSSCLRSTGEGWADSSIGWHLLINSEATIEEKPSPRLCLHRRHTPNHRHGACLHEPPRAHRTTARHPPLYAAFIGRGNLAVKVFYTCGRKSGGGSRNRQERPSASEVPIPKRESTKRGW